MSKKLPVLVAVVIMLSVSPLSASAQGGCPGLTVLDDSSRQLEVDALCEAAQPLMDRGLQVYVFVTDQNPVTESDWWELRDLAEVSWGIYDPSNDTFAITAFSVELSTVTTYPWGQDIAFGEAMFGTPLDNDMVIANIEGRLKNNVAAGDVTSAIVAAIQESVNAAYPPPPTVVPTRVVTRVPTAVPTLVQEVVPPAAIVIPTMEVASGTGVLETTGEPSESGSLNVGALLIGLLFLVAFPGVGWFVVWPLGQILWLQKKHKAQVVLIRSRINGLLMDASALLDGQTEDMALYALWDVNGGRMYPEKDAEVRRHLEQAQVAWSEANELYTQLTRQKWTLDRVQMHAFVQSWETLYVTIVGTLEHILNMTGEEQQDLFDPFEIATPDDLAEKNDLLVQMQRIHESLADYSDSLRLELQVVSPETMNKLGILGSIDWVKQAIHDLAQAKEGAEPKLAEVLARRDEVEDLPEGVSEAQAYDRVDGILTKASKALESQKWLTVMELAEEVDGQLTRVGEMLELVDTANAAMDAMVVASEDRIPTKLEVLEYLHDVIGQVANYLAEGKMVEAQGQVKAVVEACGQITEISSSLAQALEIYDTQKSEVDGILSAGFDLTSVEPVLCEASSDIDTVNEALIAGEYARAAEFVDELGADMATALAQARALRELHEANQRRLEELSVEVARVEAYRRDTAELAWVALLEYPESNWAEEAGFYERATATLVTVFDDPGNEDDLASEIGVYNSLNTQQFAAAEKMLVTAFLDLREAEGQLVAVVSQLAEVQEIEANVQATLQAVDTAIVEARAYDSEHDIYIDEGVDELLNLAETLHRQALELQQTREFTQAQERLDEARQLTAEAQREAQTQYNEVTELYAKLKQTDIDAGVALSGAAEAYNQLTEAARSSQAAEQLSEAELALREAGAARKALAGQEDHALVEALVAAISEYERAGAAAGLVLTTVQADESEYQGLLHQAESAITEAERAIANAQRYTRDGDAQSAGDSALRRAQNVLLALPAYGATTDNLQRVIAAANEASRYAADARQQAQTRIHQVEAEREAARQRRLEEERRQQRERERRERQAREARQAAERARRRSSSSSSSSFGSSSRRSTSSSFGSSSRRSSTGMGSSRRR